MPHFVDDTPHNDGTKTGLQSKPALEGRGTQEQETISSKELMDRSGATFRQIDHWCRQGYIHPIGEDTPGPGNPRRFDPGIVDRVKLVVKISAAFSRENSPLGYILEHYPDGEFDLGEGIYLTWDVVAIEREVK